MENLTAMTDTNLKAIWADVLADLTAEERAAVAEITPKDWAEAVVEVTTDRGFGQRMFDAFLNGMATRLDEKARGF